MENGSFFGIDDLATKIFKQMLGKMNLELIEKDMFKISENIYTINTFGHAIGHISILVKTIERDVIIAGDVMPHFRTLKKGYPEIIFYDKEEAKKNVEKIKELKPKYMIPGHAPPFNGIGYLERDEIEVRLVGDNGEDMIIKINKVEEAVSTRLI